MKKIHSVEMLNEKRFDKYSLEEVQDMIGYYSPSEITKTKADEMGKGVYDVTLMDDGSFTASTQFEAHVIGELEQIKAMLILLLKERKIIKGRS